ncbi:MAG: PEP-CTERM sorting domain-containing protein [Deltaproteobacteria bacterium]|nr:PEP-CTERM sorting domain-containing protein [Deltaproteobacteria bacterium]
MLKRFLGASLVLVGGLVLTSVAHATTISVDLSKNGLNGGEGNKGTSLVPLDTGSSSAPFTITAETMVDMTLPFSPEPGSDTGTIYIKDGAGVQDINGDGSKEISGGGALQNEDLVFSLDSPILMSAFMVDLVKLDGITGDPLFNKDSPVLFVSASSTPGMWDWLITEAELASIIDMDGSGKLGTIDFGLITSGLDCTTALAACAVVSALDPTTIAIDAFKFRETQGHVAVSGVTVDLEATVPEPTALLLLAGGLAALTGARRKFRS